jgi:hypothetical protein
MRKNFVFLLVFLGLTIAAGAQTRDDISVYIAPVVASPEQAAYFQENFTTETIGAGYNIAKNAQDADYTLKLEVKPNMILYDDGSVEKAPPDEKQYILQVTLIKNEDNTELVTFAFAFTTTDEMYDFNLYLLYGAMANVPLTKVHGAEYNDLWRNKWLYVRASFDYPITFYQLRDPQAIWGYNPNYPNDEKNIMWHNLDHRISPFPAVTLGIEFQYLRWMSTEANFNLSFNDPMDNSLIPAIQIEQKFIVKPTDRFMIEPYGAVSFPMNTSSESVQFPKLGVGGGVQFGVKAGERGAFFVDVNYIHFLGDVVMRNENQQYPSPDTINYTRFSVGLGVGYKVGFFDR